MKRIKSARPTERATLERLAESKRERTKLEVLQERLKEHGNRGEKDRAALQAMIHRLLSWIYDEIDFGDNGEIPAWFAEAQHMASYGVPARNGAKPFLTLKPPKR